MTSLSSCQQGTPCSRLGSPTEGNIGHPGLSLAPVPAPVPYSIPSLVHGRSEMLAVTDEWETLVANESYD
ncbi:hypothetical protein HYQ46_009038 [Verticillium longisporum]|nr:hypothetical protein HYQ46_009038 [Verticillium longisporum]